MESKECEPTALMMSEFLVLVSADTLTVDSAQQALKLSTQILAYEPENKLIKEYRKTLRDYIEHEMHEEKVNDISDEEDDSDDNEGNEENDSDDNSEGSEDGSSALSSALSANVNCRK